MAHGSIPMSKEANAIKEIGSQYTICEMSPYNPPVAHVQPGEQIKIRTVDCFCGRLRCETDMLGALPWDTINPCTGPVFVDGAVPGDILKIEIDDIALDGIGVTIQDNGDLLKYGIERPDKSMYLHVANGKILVGEHLSYPVSPMIGAIGTAPKEGNILTTLPGLHGGNMDCTQIKPGSIVYLPVFHDGGLLALGDVHASMGDGEAVGCGVEIACTVTLRVSIVRGKQLPLPLVKCDDKLITNASATTLDEAVVQAAKNMIDYLVSFQHHTLEYAWNVLAIAGHVCICQFANKLKTARCELPLSLVNGIQRD